MHVLVFVLDTFTIYRDAWKALGSISKEEAMMHYVLLVNKLDPTWKDETSLQSTMAESGEDQRIEASTVKRSCDARHCQLVQLSI